MVSGSSIGDHLAEPAAELADGTVMDKIGDFVERARIVRNLNEQQLARAIRSLLAPSDGRGPFGRRVISGEPSAGGRAPRLAELSRLVGRRRPRAAPIRTDDDGPPAAPARVQR